MPNPQAGDTERDFIARFMESAEARRDFPDEKQRAAVAYSKWRERTNSLGERVNREQQVCNGCGAAMSMDPAQQLANDCAACGARLFGPLSTPPVEDLADLCSICRHPLSIEHSGFGCNMPGCHCAATGAGGIDQLEALANGGRLPCPIDGGSITVLSGNEGQCNKCGRFYTSTDWSKELKLLPNAAENAKPTEEDFTEGRVKCSRPGCSAKAIGTIEGKPVCDTHADAKANASPDAEDAAQAARLADAIKHEMGEIEARNAVPLTLAQRAAAGAAAYGSRA